MNLPSTLKKTVEDDKNSRKKIKKLSTLQLQFEFDADFEKTK